MILHDNFASIWSISRNGEKFAIQKTSEDKDKENDFKGEICSWKKVHKDELVQIQD